MIKAHICKKRMTNQLSFVLNSRKLKISVKMIKLKNNNL